MNDRQRFNATMHYQDRDRAPISDFSFWPETLEVWKGQGLPDHITTDNAGDFFGMDPFSGSTGINVDLCPAFDEMVLEDRGEHELLQQADGVRVLRRKFMSSIPQPQGHLLADRDSWEKHYKPRLDPAHQDRLPADWDALVKRWSAPDRDYALSLPGGSLYGKLRNWMGVENISYLLLDDPLSKTGHIV